MSVTRELCRAAESTIAQLSAGCPEEAVGTLHTDQTRSGAALPSPAELTRAIPLGRRAEDYLAQVRREIVGVLQGFDRRLLAIVGPCSIHDPVAALEYASRLRPLAERYADDLIVCMRVYLEKPRSTVGWKGFVNDPFLDESCRIDAGLTLGRRLLRDITELGLPAASELLDTNVTPYLVDLMAWGAIGARTTESQPHRELASSLPIPVGFKNSTDGRVTSAIQAMQSAARPHTRLGPDSSGRLQALRTRGNPHAHLILRGSESGPNYDEGQVRQASTELERLGLPRRLLVDCSHGNSQKDHRRQAQVAAAVAQQVESGGPILGVMLESHLVAGRQDLPLHFGRDSSGLRYGQSITDACMDLMATEPCLENLARAAKRGAARAVG